MSQQFSQSRWMLTSGVARTAVAFGTNLILVRFIDPAGFGTFALRHAAISLVLTILSLRVGVIVIRLQESEFDARDRGLYWSVTLHETTLAGLLAAGWLIATGDLTDWTSILLAGILLQHLSTNAIAFYERKQPYRRIATLESLSQLTAHAAAVGLVLTGAGAAALYLRELALPLITGTALFALGAVPLERPRLLTFSEWRSVTRQARGLWLEGMLEGTFARVTVLLAGAVGGASGAGLLFQARRLAVVPQQLLSPVTSRLALNWFSREPRLEARRKSALRLLGMLGLPLVIVTAISIAFANPVVPLLFGERWEQSATLLVAMSGIVLFYAPFAIVKNLLIAERRTRYLIAARFAQFAGLALPLAGAMLGYAIGIEQVAIGLSLAFMLAFLVCLVFSFRKSPAS